MKEDVESDQCSKCGHFLEPDGSCAICPHIETEIFHI
jgi:hypothetical protein